MDYVLIIKDVWYIRVSKTCGLNHTSCTTCLALHVLHHTSCTTCLVPHVLHYTSCTTCLAPHVLCLRSCITCLALHVLCHTSCTDYIQHLCFLNSVLFDVWFKPHVLHVLSCGATQMAKGT